MSQSETPARLTIRRKRPLAEHNAFALWSVSLAQRFLYIYAREWKYGAAIFGVTTTFVLIKVPEGIGIALTVVGAILTALGFLLDTFELRGRWAGMRIDVEQAAKKGRFAAAAWWTRGSHQLFVDLSGVAAAVRADEDVVRADPEDSHEAQRRLWAQSGWTDLAVNNELWRLRPGAGTAVRLSLSKFLPPQEQRDLAQLALRRQQRSEKRLGIRTRGAVQFNGRLARLATEPTVQALRDGSLDLQLVRFFDGQASNELWDYSISSENDAPGDSFDTRYRSGAADAADCLLALENSRMANIIGISIMAITKDEQVLFVGQSQRNSIAPGRFSISGSGSLDWADVVTGSPNRQSRWTMRSERLFDVVMSGMLRELYEESGVDPELDDVDFSSARITSYFRWLDRAAKPEFTGFVKLHRDATEILGRGATSSGERVYSESVRAIPLQPLLDRAVSGSDIGAWRLGASIEEARRQLGLDAVLSPSCEATLRAGLVYLRAASM